MNSGMVLPVVAGAVITASVLAGRYGVRAWNTYKARPRRFYDGGFQQKMTKREAALILGIGEREAAEKIKVAHRRVMIANHPDAGGSHYLALKINEAKDKLMDKSNNTDSAFKWADALVRSMSFMHEKTLDVNFIIF